MMIDDDDDDNDDDDPLSPLLVYASLQGGVL